LALGGCSILERQAEEPEPTTEHPQPQSEQRRENGIEAKKDADTGPTWNLEALQAASALQDDQPLTLERAWYLAVKNDPDYQAALSGRAAAQTEIRLGRAAILPQVQA